MAIDDFKNKWVGDSPVGGYEFAYLYEGHIQKKSQGLDPGGSKIEYLVHEDGELEPGALVQIFDDDSLTYENTKGNIVVKAAAAGSAVYAGILQDIRTQQVWPSVTSEITSLATMLSSKYLRQGNVMFFGHIGTRRLRVTIPAGGEDIQIGVPANISYSVADGWKYAESGGTTMIPLHHLAHSDSVDVVGTVVFAVGMLPIKVVS